MFGKRKYKKAKRKYTPFRPREKRETYNDYYGAKTRSERELNLSAGNDYPVYEYVRKNRKTLLRRARKNHKAVIADINARGTWSKGEIDPSSVRKGYVIKLLSDKDWSA